ncbi:STAS domain-containing protein [Pontibacter korlensis]|uniref:STAS domain-containing protein n=1 Tax=Pontibacter korlensis TaxID=400092 RepID=A0A0E3ZII5_9BACT|nr:STAS domain-containing protein [Pontibacter korlensis]AKD05069.1 hypothetical protein PKOR_20815 [Pontibacter korlensis]
MREEVVVQRMGDVAVISLHGECNSAVVEKLEKRCHEEIVRRAKHILLDCEHVTTLNSSALRCMLRKSTEADEAGITLVLYHLKPEHTALIRSSGLDLVLHIKDNFKDAYLLCKARSDKSGSTKLGTT